MNHRIKELAEQAGITTNIDTDYFEKDMNKWVDYFSEKFAELLIRECVEQIGDAIPDTNCSASGVYKTAKLAATSRVKKHFGVEE